MKSSIASFLKLKKFSGAVKYKVIEEQAFDTYKRLLVNYESAERDRISAYLFIPFGDGRHPAVLVHHQHNGERHLGKSEVAGLKGDSLQAFGPTLVKRGFVVLAPDSICFEDRRKNQQGTDAGLDESDWLQHFNEMTYRLVKGDTLMRKVLDDASVSLSLLEHSSFVDPSRIGVLGHSYGGNTALFQAATDDRVKYACSSGAVCSYAFKMAHDTSFEFALTIPGFCEQFDFADLLQTIAPRDFLVVSATDDKYSKDATDICKNSQSAFAEKGASDRLQHKQFSGGHALTNERFEYIIKWITNH